MDLLIFQNPYNFFIFFYVLEKKNLKNECNVKNFRKNLQRDFISYKKSFGVLKLTIARL